MKLYHKTWFIWLMLFFLPPVGMFLMWKNQKYSKIVRIILSTVFAIWFIIYAAALTSGEQQNLNPNNNKMAAELKVHFIDVGQADSILLQQGINYMLVDTGNNTDSQVVKNYISNQGVNELQYFIGTHKDEDHIGSADSIINSFKVGKVYFPKQTATTKTFKDFVAAVKNKGLSLTVPKVGEQFKFGDAMVTVLAPNSRSYEDPNDYSIVLKISFGGTSFILTGDAETASENEMAALGMDLSATVLKVGHHGSITSTSQTFLNKVNPKYAVILVGKDNEYGHPTQEIMDRLKNKGVKVFRTDEQGTIVATSNGKDISFNVNPGSYKGMISSSTSSSGGSSATGDSETTAPSESGNGARIVYWIPGGKSYHYSTDCSTLYRSKVIEEGKLSSCPKSDPCDKCVH